MDEPAFRKEENQKESRYEDEIDLFDYIRVVWRWKYLILCGTAIVGLVAFLTVSNQLKQYRIDMIIEAPLKKIDNNEKKYYIESAGHIKGLILGGYFNKDILMNLNSMSDEKKQLPLRFSVTIPQNTDLLKISCESEKIDFGKAILTSLIKSIFKKYDERVKYFQTLKETDVQRKKQIIANLLEQKKILLDQIKETQKWLTILKTNLSMLKKDIKYQAEQNELKNITKMFADMLDKNIFLQNLQIENAYHKQIFECENRIREAKINLMPIREVINQEIEEKDNYERELLNIHNIEVRQQPTPTNYPVKPKVKRTVLMSLITGLFVFLILSFFIEYIKKHKQKIVR